MLAACDGNIRKDAEILDTEKKMDQKANENEVKSKAIVRYSAALVPAPFTLLRSNTDLNLPPSNWLSSSVAAYGVQPSILTRSDFSSFSMAHKFPDCVGVVDVVSDAENIKKLMKMCYSSSPVSLMIHRVEKTLLIDDFDLKKVLLASDGCWEWFKVFFEQVGKSLQIKPENAIEYKDKKRTAIQQKRLISKFLYHSLVPAPDIVDNITDSTKLDPKVAIPLPFVEDPQLPEPPVEEELPDPTSSHAFSRNVVWNFEDIQMLLGTDIPIFGGGTHPCVSLRLCAMNKPINVLTGLDYWLDNLMCNVPEVMMCFHLNGIVQRYELIKTEDLPDLSNSKFSPKVIRDIAQNILSFLKSNATKAGHTYWLFKGRNDEFVKLYDLTCLCTDIVEEGQQTPFTVPVAMLLYRVARNMKQLDGRNQAATICTLLKNCIELLPAQKYPEIATSAHFMLADLYVPSDLDPNKPDLSPGVSGEPAVGEPTADDTYSACRSMSISSICEPQEEPLDTSSPPSPPLSQDVVVRCMDGLKHVIMGLRCLTAVVETRHPAMAQPSEPIPMSYKSLDPKKDITNKTEPAKDPPKTLLCKPPCDTVHNESWSWSTHLKTLLYEKTVLVYLTLLEHSFSREEFGQVLRHATMVLRVLRILSRTRDVATTECSAYGKAGDALLMIATRASSAMTTHDIAFRNSSEMDLDLLKFLKRDGDTVEPPQPLPVTIDSLETILLSSAACYNHAASIATCPELRSSFHRRLGNIENELGVFYMNRAYAQVQEANADKNSAAIKNLLEVSQTHLDAGIAAFQKVEDAANLALLYSNTGRLMRLRAHLQSHENSTRSELAQQERIFYNKAICNYHLAMDVLGDRCANPVVWHSVFWELSTAYYTMATLLQDFPAGNKSPEESERELTETLHKALKYCDLDTNGARLPIYQFRCAEIHHRLASLHHSQFRYSSDESRKKHVLQLSKLHYEKAAKLLLALEYPTELLKIQMERVGLCELLAEGCTGAAIKMKHYMQGLEHIVESVPILELLSGTNTESGSDSDKSERGEQIKLLTLMLQRLQFILLSLTKLALKKTDNNKSGQCQVYKKLYSLSLACGSVDDHDINGVEIISKCILSVSLELKKALNLSLESAR